MTLTYNLTQDDYLTHQLFIASVSDTVKKQRRRSRIIWSFAFLSFGFLFFQKNEGFLAYYFLIAGILYLLFHPYYSAWYYKMHYKKHLTETYKNQFGKTATVSIDNSQIQCVGESGKTEIPTSEIERIFETGKYFFIRLKSGMSVIIPKMHVNDLNEVTNQLKELAQSRNIDFVEMPNWRWS